MWRTTAKKSSLWKIRCEPIERGTSGDETDPKWGKIRERKWEERGWVRKGSGRRPGRKKRALNGWDEERCGQKDEKLVATGRMQEMGDMRNQEIEDWDLDKEELKRYDGKCVMGWKRTLGQLFQKSGQVWPYITTENWNKWTRTNGGGGSRNGFVIKGKRDQSWETGICIGRDGTEIVTASSARSEKNDHFFVYGKK